MNRDHAQGQSFVGKSVRHSPNYRGEAAFPKSRSLPQGGEIETARVSNRNLVTLAWGAFLIWWGIADGDFGLVPSLPPGTGWVGVGLILLGLNAARWRLGTPVSSFSITIGILALSLGVLKLAGALPHPPIEVPTLAILMIELGGIVLWSALASRETA
jgi:hypothetical protein